MKDNDTDASENLKIKEDKYKIKYKTVQKDGPLDVTIQIYNNTEEASSEQLPYVVEFTKGAQGSKQDLIKYYNSMRHQCFEETK